MIRLNVFFCLVHVYQLCYEFQYCPGKEVINTSMNQNTLIDVVRSGTQFNLSDGDR